MIMKIRPLPISILALWVSILLCSCQREVTFNQHVSSSAFSNADSVRFMKFGADSLMFIKRGQHKDLLVLIPDHSQSKEDIIRYAELFYFMGFDVLFYDYANGDGSISLESIKARYDGVQRVLLRMGYAQNRIVLFGSNKAAAIALAISSGQNLRGCIVENPANEIDSYILTLLASIKAPIIFLQGENSQVSKPQTTVQYFLNVPANIKKQIVILPNITDKDMFYDDAYIQQVNRFYPTISGFNKTYPRIKW